MYLKIKNLLINMKNILHHPNLAEEQFSSFLRENL